MNCIKKKFDQGFVLCGMTDVEFIAKFPSRLFKF